MSAETVWGLLAEFPDPQALVRAAEAVRDAGYTRWDAHAPFVVHALDEAMGIRTSVLRYVVFLGGLMGAVGALALQWWTNAVDYAYVISGKPLFSLPANIPVVFELTVLFAGISAMVGMLALNGLPRLHHPLFAVDRFRRATNDRFFISVEAADPRFDLHETRRFLEQLGATAVEEVPA